MGVGQTSEFELRQVRFVFSGQFLYTCFPRHNGAKECRGANIPLRELPERSRDPRLPVRHRAIQRPRQAGSKMCAGDTAARDGRDGFQFFLG
jgi:hypothetical protein